MKRLITTGKVLAILTAIAGVVHGVMTFLPVIDGAAREQTYFSLGCGLLPILCGVLFVMLLGRVERHEFLVSPLVVIGFFALVNGILAVCFMLTNPFAWVALTLGVGLYLTAMGIRARHRRQ